MTWLHQPQNRFALNCWKRFPPANPLIPYAHKPPDCSPQGYITFPPTLQAPPFFMQPSFKRCFWSCLVDSPTSASPSCFPIIRNPDDLSKAANCAIEVTQKEEILSYFLNRSVLFTFSSRRNTFRCGRELLSLSFNCRCTKHFHDGMTHFGF